MLVLVVTSWYCSLEVSFLDPQCYPQASMRMLRLDSHSCQVGARTELRPSDSRVHAVVSYAASGSVKRYDHFGGQFGKT